MAHKKLIQVFEHSFLPLDEVFEHQHFVALSKLNALHQYAYFDLQHNGVLFKQFVGVLQVGDLTIEILPKIDRNESDSQVNKNKWQQALIQILKATRKLNIQQVGEANVSKQSIHLLDIYFDLFLKEIEILLHKGLIKRYDKKSGNVKALKGKLEFSQHIQKNLVHKNRFFTTHQVYHDDHLIHQILGQALFIITQFSKGTYRYINCKKILLDFPNVKTIEVNESTFNQFPKNRKIEVYEKALSIARLILLNYAPNIKSGSENMLALLFDMNNLWEEYILVQLKKVAPQYGIEVYGQYSKSFWNGITIRPDIVLRKLTDGKEDVLVIDTKWKNIDQSQPSTHDLRQMYVYNEYWKAQRSMLLYPSNDTNLQSDQFIEFEDTDHACALGKLSIFTSDGLLNNQIGEVIIELLNNTTVINKPNFN